MFWLHQALSKDGIVKKIRLVWIDWNQVRLQRHLEKNILRVLEDMEDIARSMENHDELRDFEKRSLQILSTHVRGAWIRIGDGLRLCRTEFRDMVTTRYRTLETKLL